MIAHLQGKIIHASEKFIILEAGSVGYKVFATPETIASLAIGESASLFTYLAVRENALDLYGFTSEEEQSLFELLLEVSGIGPKSAIGILAVASIDTLTRAIATGDTSYLNKVSGIGKKTAEKIILELRDKLKSVSTTGESGSLRSESDVVEALKSLGYSQNEARDALKHVPGDIEGTNARIKEALKILSGK
jgi:Holliday junction DNA helicase RuvA